MIMNLNAVLSVIFNVPAAIASTVRSYLIMINALNPCPPTPDHGFARSSSAL